jgi:hypothetical protein
MAITPTTITSQDQVYLTGSPINLRIRNLAGSNTIKSAVCELYIWSGNLNAPPTLPSYTLVADKVSKLDNYINFQIAEILRSHIVGTKFAWVSGNDAPSIAGEGVFFQTKYQVTNDSNIESAISSTTNFATLGYRYDFEQVGDVGKPQPYLSLLPINYSRNYTDKIKYFKRAFDFTKTLGTATTENVISSVVNPLTTCKPQLGDKYLVVYINRLGLWDYFTPYGKAVKNIKVNTDTNPRLYRNPNSINNNIIHSKSRKIDNSEQTYIINTGDLNETMTEQVEEVIYSPLVYLMEYTGEVYTTVNLGLTVDTTTVTVDNTTYTVDNDTVTTLDLGYYSTYKQIPVTCENQSFTKKTRLNDKGKINYELNFNVTIGRINNLR